LPRITLIELVDYRKWTEELGYDREGLIQIEQSRIYNTIQKLFWLNNCFVLPFRYDYYIALTNGLNREKLSEIAGQIERETPYGVKTVSTTHKYPSIALYRASMIIRNNKFYYEDGDEDKYVIVHLDLNNITEMAFETSIYEAYLTILDVYRFISNYVFKHNGIASYLGGDNLFAILPEEEYKLFLEIIPTYIKAGVGISHNSRKALELAARALSMIRSGRVRENIIVLHDSS